jgi:hypothetical protein
MIYSQSRGPTSGSGHNGAGKKSTLIAIGLKAELLKESESINISVTIHL